MSVANWDRGTRVLGASLTFAAVIALCTWGGNWLDETWGTQPLFLILGALYALVAGFLYLLKQFAPDLLPFGKRRGAAGEPTDDRSKESEPGDRDPRT